MWNRKSTNKRTLTDQLGFSIWSTVHSPTGAELPILCASRADQARKHAADRANIIKLLGWEPEQYGVGHPESYCATTRELVQTLRERALQA